MSSTIYASALLSLLALLPSTLATAPTSGTTYEISPASYTDLCLAPESETDGAHLIVTDCSADATTWTWTGSKFQNTAANLCIDLTDGNVYSGNKMQVWECFDGNTNQEWATDGTTITFDSEFCLDLTDGDGSSGTEIQIWSCYSGNTNQEWTFTEVEESDDCETTTASSTDDASSVVSSSASVTSVATTSASAVESDPVTATASATASISDVTASATASELATDVTTSATTSANSTIGNDLWASNGWTSSATASPTGSSTSSGHHHNATSASGSASVTSSASDAWETASATQTNSTDAWQTASATSTNSSNAWETASTTSDAWETASATASASASANSSSSSNSSSTSTAATSTYTPSSSSTSGYLQTSGTVVVDPSGNTVQLRGINIGGWLVLEDWMCGITDSTGGADRFSLTTLTTRFGEDQADTLMAAWVENWFTTTDWDNIASIGYNVVRIPFSYRTLMYENGTWRDDAYTNMDWAVEQAKARDIYIIFDYHIWPGQAADYSAISENTDDGQSQRDAAAEVWKQVATHYYGESQIFAFDVINEPTGSYGNYLQIDLYNAVRAVDSARIVIHESISTDPSTYSWTQVIYSIHEYNMMGSDYSSNVATWASGVTAYYDTWSGYGIPTLLAEFMADGDTLDYMLDQANTWGMSWLSWSHSSVNMGRWGLWNHASFSVDVGSDSYDTILAQWSNPGSVSETTDIYSTFAAAAQGSTSQRKRDVPATSSNPSPRAQGTKRTSRHGGRSRRSPMVHGSKGGVF